MTNAKATGPLVVSQTNPRYFAVASASSNANEKVVYLTGSHIWNNFQDGMGPGPKCSDRPELFDYEAYMAFLWEIRCATRRKWTWRR